MKPNKINNTLNKRVQTRVVSREVIPLNITLTRSLNGKPVTHEEMKLRVFRSDVFNQVLVAVNARLNGAQEVTPDDNGKING